MIYKRCLSLFLCAALFISFSAFTDEEEEARKAEEDRARKEAEEKANVEVDEVSGSDSLDEDTDSVDGDDFKYVIKKG